MLVTEHLCELLHQLFHIKLLPEGVNYQKVLVGYSMSEILSEWVSKRMNGWYCSAQSAELI
jgi:hypothetical protein